MTANTVPLLLDARSRRISTPCERKGATGPPAHVCSLNLGSCATNLVLAVLGAGQLVLPYALSQLGLAAGLVALLFLALLSVHSCYVLSLYELHFRPDKILPDGEVEPQCLESYAELLDRVFGRFGQAMSVVLLASYAWGGALSFLIILKSELASLTGLDGGLCLALTAGAFIFPLSACRDLTVLKTFSPLGCIAAIFITVCVLFSSRWEWSAPHFVEVCQGPRGAEGVDYGELRWLPKSFLAVAASLPLFSFALNSSWAYIPVLCTLKARRPERYSMLISMSNMVILVNYVCLSTYGYAMFCERTDANILDSLGAAAQVGTAVAFFVRLAQGALSVQLSLALPMRFYVARRTLGGAVEGLLGRAAIESLLGRALISAALVGSATILAALPLSLNLVLGITSSICASMIIYILPALVDLSFRIEDPLIPRSLRLAFSVVSLLVGAFVLGGGLVANLLGIAVGN